MERTPEYFAGKPLAVGIIGCGYVGLPLALRYAGVGHRVTAFDTDQGKVAALNGGRSYIKHISSDSIAGHIADGNLTATSQFSRRPRWTSVANRI